MYIHAHRAKAAAFRTDGRSPACLRRLAPGKTDASLSVGPLPALYRVPPETHHWR